MVPNQPEPRLLKQAEAFVNQAHAAGGLAPVDLDRFWADHAEASRDPWSADCPQVPLGIGMAIDCVFDELGIPETSENWYRMEHDHGWRVEVSRQYNDLAQKIVGRSLLPETMPNMSLQWPPIKELYHIFEARNVWHDRSFWLEQSAHGEDELQTLLDRVEARLENLREFMLPSNWGEEKQRLLAAGAKVPLYRGQRGPITFAASMYGAEDLLYLILDNPELAGRFRDLILKAILERARVLDEEAGYTPETAPHGWGWADDNCCLLNPSMYEFFGYPILKAVFERYSPNPGDMRGQHSDSDMAHHLPALGRLGLTWANFGPTVTVSEIRQHLPKAVILGQLAPFTFSRNEELNMVAEFLRDYEQAREHRGLVFGTAGSTNNGSRLTGMRLIMSVIQQVGNC
ncbi:MAG: uroporphyrinogen decarboxylase family protein [Armatimonadota bacterium]